MSDTKVHWAGVKDWIAEQRITLEGHELLSWPYLTEPQRAEALLKSAFVQWAESRPERAGEPVTVQMTYDPVRSPQRLIYGPLFQAA